MIVLKKSTASLTTLSHRMYKYWTGQAVTISTLRQDSYFYKHFTGGISVKVYAFPWKGEGADHRYIVYLKKKEISVNQKSGEKPQKL